MPAAAADDRFSDLPDDLLVHVLSFLPVTDAARTAALSRRWRPLWLHTGTLNLDSRPHREHTTIHRRIRRRLFRDAACALSALATRSPAPVTRLSLFVEGDGGDDCQNVLGCSPWLLADPALRRVEELRVGFRLAKESGLRFIYKMPPRALRAMAAALRVLDLDYCHLELPPPHAAFPRLASLRLDRCSMPAPHLAALIRAAPNLAVLHIQRHDLDGYSDDSAGEEKDRLDLHCPNLTSLTLADLDRLTYAKPIDVFTPCLRTFSYSGHFTEFSMKADAPNLARVDLKFCPFYEVINNVPVLIWRFLGALRHTKAMKLAVLTTDDIALDRTAAEDDEHHLPMLPRLERLELEADFDGGDTERAAAAIKTLLQCCLVIRDLKLRLTHSWNWVRCRKRKRDKSVMEIVMDLFERRRRSDEIVLMLDDDDGDSLGVVDLQDLTGCWFNCLDDRLKNVELRFLVKGATSFEVCRAKFFGENLKALEVRASNR